MSRDSQYAELMLDPSASPQLQRELPGLNAALDEHLMRGNLQVLLLDRTNSHHTIASCELDQATYAADIGVVLRYLIGLQNEAGSPAGEYLVTGRLFADQAACDSYLRDHLLPAAARL